jgi:hypothetical protein
MLPVSETEELSRLATLGDGRWQLSEHDIRFTRGGANAAATVISSGF